MFIYLFIYLDKFIYLFIYLAIFSEGDALCISRGQFFVILQLRTSNGILLVEENQSFMLDYNEPKKQSAFEIPTPCRNCMFKYPKRNQNKAMILRLRKLTKRVITVIKFNVNKTLNMDYKPSKEIRNIH